MGQQLTAAKVKRILILEDDELISRLLQAILKNGGYEVTAFFNATEALQCLADSNEKIDLIITDLLMPVIGGFDFISELKKTYKQKHFMVVTSLRDKSTQEKAKSAGAADYIIKPFKSSDVLNRLNRFFNSLEQAS